REAWARELWPRAPWHRRDARPESFRDCCCRSFSAPPPSYTCTPKIIALPPPSMEKAFDSTPVVHNVRLTRWQTGQTMRIREVRPLGDARDVRRKTRQVCLRKLSLHGAAGKRRRARRKALLLDDLRLRLHQDHVCLRPRRV